MGVLLPPAHAQKEASKTPSVYPSTPGSKSMFVYIPGQIAVASEGQKPNFDRKTAESLKQYCPGVKVLASPKEADYVTFYSEEWKRDLTVVRNDGEVVFAGNSFWEKKSVVAKACAEIIKDWKERTAGGQKTGNP
jgi:hypothetical protein